MQTPFRAIIPETVNAKSRWQRGQIYPLLFKAEVSYKAELLLSFADNSPYWKDPNYNAIFRNEKEFQQGKGECIYYEKAGKSSCSCFCGLIFLRHIDFIFP